MTPSLVYNLQTGIGAVPATARLLHLVDLVMWHRAIAFMLFAWLFNPGLLLAQAGGAGGGAGRGGGDVFTVSDLAVDVTAESAVRAREIALQNGQRLALGHLLRRITLRTDHASLPIPDHKAIAQLVASVAVAREKTSTVRYLAALTVRFHRAAIRDLLRGAEIRFSETRSKPILVLAVLEKGAAQSLFEDGNIWRDAWGRLDLAPDALLPLRLPLGDLQDITTITAPAALAGRDDQLRAIAQRYEVENVLVVHAILSIDLAAGGLPQVQVNLLRFGPRGKSTEVLDYTVRIGNDLDGALAQLALRVAVDQQEQWNRRTQLSFGIQASLSALVPVSGLADWLTVRKRLAASAMVKSVQLQGLSRQDAQVVIDYLGDTDSLVVALAQLDLHLSLVDGFWLLKLAGQNVTADGGGDAGRTEIGTESGTIIGKRDRVKTE